MFYIYKINSFILTSPYTVLKTKMFTLGAIIRLSTVYRKSPPRNTKTFYIRKIKPYFCLTDTFE